MKLLYEVSQNLGKKPPSALLGTKIVWPITYGPNKSNRTKKRFQIRIKCNKRAYFMFA